MHYTYCISLGSTTKKVLIQRVNSRTCTASFKYPPEDIQSVSGFEFQTNKEAAR